MHNSEKYIDGAIKSALRQLYRDIEIVVVDDGSTDNSLRVVRKIAEDNSQVKIYAREKHGVSAARNYGILKATGDFVFFLDSDDTIDAGVINALVEKTINDNLVGCSVQFVKRHSKAPVRCNSVYSSADFIEKMSGNNNEVHGYACGFLFKRQLCPSFNEKIGYCEDMLFLVEYILRNNIEKILHLDGKDGYYNYIQNIKSTIKVTNNIFEKIQSISQAMDILDAMTGKKYTDQIEEKRILLFKYEMSYGTKNELVEIMNNYQLKKYNGNLFGCKLFSYLFRNKRAGLMIAQFRLKRIIKKILNIGDK